MTLTMTRRAFTRTSLAAGLLLLGGSLEACGGAEQTSTTAPSGSTNDVTRKAQDAIANLTKQVIGKGPNGETAVPGASITLTPDEINTVKAMNATAAICMYAQIGWTTAQVSGLQSEFARLGIRVIAVTNGEGKVDKQVSDVETVLARKPSTIVTVQADPKASASVFQRVAAQGVKTVFIGAATDGLTHGSGYVGIVDSDEYGYGAISAHLMALALKGRGKIGLLFWQTKFFNTDQRTAAFRQTIHTDYPEIQIVEEKGFLGPNFADECQTQTSAWLTRYADLAGVWAPWDGPSEGILAAARTAGRSDLVVTTCDLGENVAISLLQGGVVKGIAAQRVFEMGVTEARVAAYGLLGKAAPAYATLPNLAVTHSNVLQSWQAVYHQSAPQTVQSAAQSH